MPLPGVGSVVLGIGDGAGVGDIVGGLVETMMGPIEGVPVATTVALVSIVGDKDGDSDKDGAVVSF